jgi:hypothetical protein
MHATYVTEELCLVHVIPIRRHGRACSGQNVKQVTVGVENEESKGVKSLVGLCMSVVSAKARSVKVQEL